MIIRLRFRIYSSTNNDGLIYEKEYDSAIVPTIGGTVIDSIFEDPRPIVDVSIDFHKNVCVVYLEGKEVRPEALNGHIQEVAELHNWTLYVSQE